MMTLNDLECPIQLKVRMSHRLLADSVDTSLASLFSLLYTSWAIKRCHFYFNDTTVQRFIHTCMLYSALGPSWTYLHNLKRKSR